MNRIVRACALALVAVLLAAASANAATVRLHDHPSDVYTIDVNDDLVLAHDADNADLTGLVATHSRSRLKVTAAYRTLVRSKGVYTFGVHIRTNTGKRFIALAGAGAGHPRGDHVLIDEGKGGDDFATDDDTCRGMKHSFNYRKSTVVLSIPRTCLGRPSWVKLQGQSFAVQGIDLDSEDFGDIFLDDLLSPHAFSARWSPRITVG